MDAWDTPDNWDSEWDEERPRRKRKTWAFLAALGAAIILCASVAWLAWRGVAKTSATSGTPTVAAARPTRMAKTLVKPLLQVPPTELANRPTDLPTSQPTRLPAISPTNAPARPLTNQPTPQPASQPDLPSLQRLMLDLVNADRRQAGLGPVAWDELAAQVGAAHAQEMATHNYVSHWNLQGYGPDVRYRLAGGSDSMMENVYMYWFRYDDGRPAPIQDWPEVIREAETSLMDSPGHRANILDPDHTHVGIGIAYNVQTGDVRIAQEFINRYVTLESLPRQARVGEALNVLGTLLPGSSAPLINLAYEPFPKPLTENELNNKMPRTYTSPAEIFQPLDPIVTDDHLAARVTLDNKRQPGLYHIRVWVKASGRDVIASDVVVWVQ